MESKEMVNGTSIAEEMQDTKAAENRREDKKAFKRLLPATIICGVFGFFAGVLSAGMEDGLLRLAETVKGAVLTAAPFGNLLLGTLTWIICAVLMRQSHKIYATWDGEDENTIEQVELKLNYGICVTSVSTILSFLFFGLGMYAVEFTSLHLTAVIIKFAVAFAGFMYSMIMIAVLQKNLVNFTKEINPEKRGSVYDLRFQKRWMESCDESERLQTYRAGYAAMQTGNYTCLGLCILCFIGMQSWNFGIMPMLMVSVVWLALIVRYHIEGIRMAKKSGGC